jgi:hypothetical protein
MMYQNQTVVDTFCNHLSCSTVLPNKAVVFFATITYQHQHFQIVEEAMVEVVRDYPPYLLNFIRSTKLNKVLPASVKVDYGSFEIGKEGCLLLKASHPRGGLLAIAIRAKG